MNSDFYLAQLILLRDFADWSYEELAAELEQLCKSELKRLAEEAKKTEEAVRQIVARRVEVEASRSQLAKEIPAAQLKRYDKLLVKRKGLAVVRIVGGLEYKFRVLDEE